LLRDPPETIGRDDRDGAAADPHEAQVLQPFQGPIYPTARSTGELGEFFLRNPHRRTAGAPRTRRCSQLQDPLGQADRQGVGLSPPWSARQIVRTITTSVRCAVISPYFIVPRN